MWLFSELGFFSINRTPDGSDLQFRARREADLENLKAKFPQYFVGRDIMELPAADYRWRLETTDVYAGAIMAQMTAGISYRNFKSHLATTDQADKLGILHDLWHQLHEYQQEQLLAGSWMEGTPPKMQPTRLAREEGVRELFPDYLSRAAANEEAIEHGDEESDEVVQFFPIGAPPAEPPYDALTEAEQLDRDREIDDSNEPLPDDRVYWPDDEDDSDGSGM